MKKIALLSNIAVFLFVIACGGGGGTSSSDTAYPRFTSEDDTIVQYAFSSSINASLSGDATGAISDSTIEVSVPHGTEVTALIAEFVSNSSRVEVNGVVETRRRRKLFAEDVVVVAGDSFLVSQYLAE